MAVNKTPVRIDPRKKKLPKYRSFRISGRLSPDTYKKLPKAKVLWKETFAFMWKYRYKMLGLLFFYAVVYGIFVRGTSGFELNVSSVKDQLFDFSQGSFQAFIQFVYLYSSLLSSITFTQEGSNTNFYQIVILVIFSLAFIWLVRKLHARDSEATVRQALYVGMGPLIPFVLVLGLLLVEMLPLGFATFLISVAVGTGSIATGADNLILVILFLLCFTLSLYLVAGSIFSLYIVTLPGTPPLVAVRSSMRLLRIHRWRILLKIISFFAILILAGFFLVLPFIIWLPKYAELAFFIMTSFSFGVMHVYMYKLYKSML